jgi:hypothetical protein
VIGSGAGDTVLWMLATYELVGAWHSIKPPHAQTKEFYMLEACEHVHVSVDLPPESILPVVAATGGRALVKSPHISRENLLWWSPSWSGSCGLETHFPKIPPV